MINEELQGQINWAWRAVITGMMSIITGFVISTYNKVNESHDFIVAQKFVNLSTDKKLDEHSHILFVLQSSLNKNNGSN